MEHISHDDTAQRIDLISELLCICLSSSTRLLPCCVLHRGSIDDVGEKVTPKILFYDSFGQCLKLHKEWLQNSIKNFIIRSKNENNSKRKREKKNHVEARYDRSDDDDIVIAYVSGNSPDMLLSVLACTSSTLKPAIPALLNTRWTPSEMISSLKSTADNVYDATKTKRRRQIYTILLHDGSALLENTAHQVSNGLRKVRNQQNTYCLPIPLFSQTYSVAQSPADICHPPSNDSDNIVLQRRMRTYQKKASKSDAIILFTSGTTGGVKGVRLSDRALLVQALAKNYEPCGYSAATAMLATTVPLFHVGGLSSFIAVILAKGQLIFPARDGIYISNKSTRSRKNNSKSNTFQVQDISKSLQDTFLPANTLVVVPAMLVSFFLDNNHDNKTRQKQQQQQFLKTRLILIGGQSVSNKILEQTRQTFPNARIVQTYACTEAASSLTFLTLAENNSSKHTNNGIDSHILSIKKPLPIAGDCVGIPPSHIELRIYPRKPSSQNTLTTTVVEPILNPYELGLIATKGSHVMNGYWQRGNMKNKNMNSINSNNRWFISNDLGYWDEQGMLYFGGRAKDVIRTGGETVLCQEVERIIQMHPIVVECAIFPRRDDQYGEIVACALVTQQIGIISINDIKQWCQQNGLAGYKRPKILFFLETLPRNSSGKILKHKLVSQFGSRIRSKL